jgi:NAD-dependent deacetylase
VELLAPAHRVCVLTGAGISTDSGIPDFRGPQGIWTKDPAAASQATLQHYLSSPAVRAETWRRRASHRGPLPRPNRGHLALVELQRQGRLHALITQNVDGLHLAAGIRPDLLVEIHGHLRGYRCLRCGREGRMEEVLERVRHGESDPACPACGGILKSAAISFGQPLEAEAVRRAEEAAQDCDLFLAVGTRLEVQPAATLPLLALRHRAPLVIVNLEPTRLDRRAAAVVRIGASQALPRLIGSAADR